MQEVDPDHSECYQTLSSRLGSGRGTKSRELVLFWEWVLFCEAMLLSWVRLSERVYLGVASFRVTLNFIHLTCSYWQPGETLPLVTPQNMRSNSPDLFVPESPVNSGVGNNVTVMDVLQTFQSSLDKQLTTVSTQLESIGTKTDKLESRQSSLEEEVRAST